MLKHDSLVNLNWLASHLLAAADDWNDSPDSVVSWFSVKADLLIAGESSECHWGDWATVQVKRFVQDV